MKGRNNAILENVQIFIVHTAVTDLPIFKVLKQPAVLGSLHTLGVQADPVVIEDMVVGPPLREHVRMKEKVGSHMVDHNLLHGKGDLQHMRFFCLYLCSI